MTVGALGQRQLDDGRRLLAAAAPPTTAASSPTSWRPARHRLRLRRRSHISNNCGTKTLSGTSMSCPTTAGAAPCCCASTSRTASTPPGRQRRPTRLRPRAALVKAALLNGTLPLAGAGLDTIFGNNNYGWGRVFLENNLFFTGDGRECGCGTSPTPTASRPAAATSTRSPVAAGQEFRATLVWIGPRAQPRRRLHPGQQPEPDRRRRHQHLPRQRHDRRAGLDDRRRGRRRSTTSSRFA